MAPNLGQDFRLRLQIWVLTWGSGSESGSRIGDPVGCLDFDLGLPLRIWVMTYMEIDEPVDGREVGERRERSGKK